MRPYFNSPKFTFTIDKSFRNVMQACGSTERKNQGGGTWISEEIIEAYCTLHEMGYAHSAEVWDEKGNLVGGLYGLALGKVFFGESMFAKVSNASKFAFISMVKKLSEWGFQLIDCQQETSHLVSLGARAISREDFMALLERWIPNQPEEATFQL